MAMYGYIRVSSVDQNEARQVLALHEFGVPKCAQYIDKCSGKDFARPEYKRLVKRLRPGDVLVVKSIDRLGRNYAEIIEQWRVLTREKHAHIVVLDMPLLDTRASGRDLTGTFIADLVLQILSYVAETERESIRLRQAEGIAAARGRGVRFGAPKKSVPEGFPALCAAWREGAISARCAGRTLGVAPQTFLRWCAERDRSGT